MGSALRFTIRVMSLARVQKDAIPLVVMCLNVVRNFYVSKSSVSLSTSSGEQVVRPSLSNYHSSVPLRGVIVL